MKALLCILALFLTTTMSPMTFAQEATAESQTPPQAPLAPPSKAQPLEKQEVLAEESKTKANKNVSFNFKEFPSLLFTYGEQEAVDNARRSDGMKSLPTQAELDGSDGTLDGMPPPEARFINLSGISYKSPRRWTIWLNKQRVTPKNIPPEILDLKVFKNYVEIQWFDEYTNQIFPIRLRAQERFNMDTKTFLPG